MVNEVNKLIYNTLISDRAVLLPDVGTLFISREAAKEVSRGRVESHRYTLSLSSNKAAVSLIDIIARVASISNEQATDIYSRWLEKMRTEGCITIEGIGRLCNKSFVVDDSFDKVLNPVVDSIVKIDERKSRVASLSVALLLIAFVVVGLFVYRSYVSTPIDNSETIQSTIVYNNIEKADNEIIIEADNHSELVEQQGSDEIEAKVIEGVIVDNNDWRESDNIRHWVVIGSYSTVENVERAVADFQTKYPELNFDYIKLGSMFAVSPCGSVEIAECEEFMHTHKGDFPQMWIHTPKKYKE